MIEKPPSPREKRIEKVLEDGVYHSGLKNKPFRIRHNYFRYTVAEKLRGYTGPPAFAFRLKRIEDWMESRREIIREAWIELAQKRRMTPDKFRRKWLKFARDFDFSQVNELIDQHNRYYPIERNLPIDIRTGVDLDRGKPFKKRPYLDKNWILNQFPPDLELALQEAARMQNEEGTQDR